MKYQLIEDYFETFLFQQTVQEYFDTVLAALLTDHSLTETKGRFVVDGAVQFHGFDMPYPIHILNGLIPTLRIYEQFLQSNGQEENPDSATWLKVFMIGFTLHDANKLVRVSEQKGKSDLELALDQLRADLTDFRVHEFFPAFNDHQNDVFFLALATENRTRLLANEYPAKRITRETLAPLCHLADGLASIQEVESPATVFESVHRKMSFVESVFGKLPVSYVEVHPNPYTLTSQNILMAARKELHLKGKKVLYALRTGFVFFGEDVTADERSKIQQTFLNQNDLDPIGLTKVDAQKCEFGFLGSIPFTDDVLGKVVGGLQHEFLALSPNGRDKIHDFDDFVEFLKKFLAAFAPVDQFINPVLDKTGSKLYLHFAENSNTESDGVWFREIYILHKIQWLNVKKNRKWAQDLKKWEGLDESLPQPFEFNSLIFQTLKDIFGFLSESANDNGLQKTILCIVKTWKEIFANEKDWNEIKSGLQDDILLGFPTLKGVNPKADFFQQFFHYQGQGLLPLLQTYQPSIPAKKEMCLFTGSESKVPYTEAKAFGVRARGFSNRTVTNLGNTKTDASKISPLFREENQLRKKNFNEQKKKEFNLCLYTDFFETSLDISRDIITAAVKAKNKDLKIVDSGAIEFDKSARFHYNLFNLDFVSLAPKVKDTFWQVRRWLLMVKKLGLRAYVTGIMSPYVPHKAVFHFENAPAYLQSLGWHQVRLSEVEAVLNEMKLVLSFGVERIPANLLQIAISRRAYFRLFYRLNADDQKKVRQMLTDFLSTHPQHFLPSMTIIEQLVGLALKIEVASLKSSGATETWLIRTATEKLRTYHKQERPREEIIAKISAEIYRVMKNKPMWITLEITNASEQVAPKVRLQSIEEKMTAIENFATAVYDLLFLEAWKEKLPTANFQKDWIYEFAFIFKKQSIKYWEEYNRNKKAKDENEVPVAE